MSDESTPEELVQAELEKQGIVKEEKEDAKEEKAVSQEAEKEVLKEEAPKSSVADLATKFGWKEDGPKSAEEFISYALENLEPRGKELKSLKSQMNELMGHVGNLKKAGYEDQIAAIKAERDEAVARSDVESVDYLNTELNKVNTELQNENVAAPMHPAAVEFMERHEAILNDYSLEGQEIQQFIQERDNSLGQFNLDPEVHIQTLEKDLRTKFPTRFNTEQEVAAPMVESDSAPLKTKGKKVIFSDLSPDQKQICRKLEKSGVMSSEDYIQQLIDTEAL